MIYVAKPENGMVHDTRTFDPCITTFKGVPFAAPPIGKTLVCSPACSTLGGRPVMPGVWCHRHAEVGI